MSAVTLEVSELQNILHNTLIFASTDNTLPVLCTVELSELDGRLMGMSTDRYQLCQVRGETTAIDNEFYALLTTGDVKILLGALKGEKGPVTLEVTAGKLSYSCVSGTAGGFQLRDFMGSSYPKIASLVTSSIEKIGKGDGGRHLMFNPKFLANLGKLKDHSRKHDGALSLLSADEKSNVMWAFGDFARGMICPLRHGDLTTEAVLGAWA